MRNLFNEIQLLFNPINNFNKEYIAERLASLLIFYEDRYKDIRDKKNYDEWLKEHKELTEEIIKFFNTERLGEFQEWKMQPIDINRTEYKIEKGEIK